MKSHLVMTVITACILSTAAAPLGAEADKTGKQLRIKWEQIEGMIRYQVQIQDASGSSFVDKTVETNYVDFRIPPGKYRIRVGAINKFEKVSFWSEWEDFEIRKAEKSKFFSNDFPAKGGFKICGGASYNMILPPWNSLYRNSSFNTKHLNYIGSIGFHFGDSKFVKSENFLKYMGVELEGSFCRYRDRADPLFQSSLLNINGGPNLFIKTRLRAPINFYLRAGGGAAYSLQKYARYNLYGMPTRIGTIKSLDPYAKIGVAAELSFLYALSLNVGVDYFIIFYSDKFFSHLRYFAMMGVRI